MWSSVPSIHFSRQRTRDLELDWGSARFTASLSSQADTCSFIAKWDWGQRSSFIYLAHSQSSLKYLRECRLSYCKGKESVSWLSRTMMVFEIISPKLWLN